VFKKIGFKIISETIDKGSRSDKYDILHHVYMEQKVFTNKVIKKQNEFNRIYKKN
tara:strand:- start:1550 stop:1714 length:165 start_codon:yes stop_codon:yes gene_type:complete